MEFVTSNCNVLQPWSFGMVFLHYLINISYKLYDIDIWFLTAKSCLKIKTRTWTETGTNSARLDKKYIFQTGADSECGVRTDSEPARYNIQLPQEARLQEYNIILLWNEPRDNNTMRRIPRMPR